jgi:hypothetical protein
MSLSDLAAIGSLVSGIAVLGSLVYLSLQVKQSERNQQAAIRQGRTGRSVDISLALTEPSVADAVMKGRTGAADMTATQASQFLGICGAIFGNYEDGFYQHKDGLLNDSAFDSLVVLMRSTFRFPGNRAMWTIIRGQYGSEYVDCVDKIVSETPLVTIPTGGSFLDFWNAAVQAELSKASS